MVFEERKIQMADGIMLHSKIKESGSAVWIIATHGVGEHSERHNYLIKLLAGDFNILLYDLRGHGKSEGRPAHIQDFSQYMEDLSKVVGFLQSKYHMKRHILFGHSMGALITAGYVQTYAAKEFYPERVFFSAPPVAFPGPLGSVVNLIPRGITQIMRQWSYGIKLKGLIDLTKLSHDYHIYEDYINDPLCHKSLSSQLVFNLMNASKQVFARPLRVSCPAYCAIGTADAIVSFPSAQKYFSLIEKGVVFKAVEGAYHEMHNEIDKYRQEYFEFLKTSLLESLYFN